MMLFGHLAVYRVGVLAEKLSKNDAHLDGPIGLGNGVETVALGALIIAWHANAQPEILIERLDRCKVRWRPSEMGLSRDQLRDGLAFTPEYMQAREIDSILRHQPVAEARFDSLWETLEG
jgi:hypothetical protein